MLAIAHRGASAYAPENTRSAFDLAIRMGAAMIETDVQITRDGELVLFHDDLVDRTSDGVGPVADHTLADLRALDLGGWFGPAFAGEQIVTLAEFQDEVMPRIPVCLEIKDPMATGHLIDFLNGRDAKERVQVTSFSWSALLQSRARLAVSTGFLCRRFNFDTIERCAARGFAQICPPVSDLELETVAIAHEKGLEVRAWGVRERSDIDRLFATGADGATSNWPDWITEYSDAG